jgi:hypothetical protein
MLRRFPPPVLSGNDSAYAAYPTVDKWRVAPMAGNRAAELRALASECLMLASTATDPIVWEGQLAQAEIFLALGRKLGAHWSVQRSASRLSSNNRFSPRAGEGRQVDPCITCRRNGGSGNCKEPRISDIDLSFRTKSPGGVLELGVSLA